MKNKLLIGLGSLTTALWLCALVGFLGLKDIFASIAIGYVGLGWIVPAILFACVFDTEEGYTGHKCNLCNSRIKIGEGMHFPRISGVDTCYCICPKCLPNLSKSIIK